MRILWVTNALLPEALAKLRGENELKGTGSWVMAMSYALAKNNNINLSIAAISDLVNELTVIKGNRITYYAFPRGKGDVDYNKDYESIYKRIDEVTRPDLVHIHGSEYPHSLAALRAFGREKCVVSLQGVVSSLYRYYLGDIPKVTFFKNITFHDILRPSSLGMQKRMKKCAGYERELFSELKYVIGRTTWDRAQVWALNPNVNYFHCNEVLRKEFYCDDIWSYESCKPHSIFLSQAGYPLKGLHKVLDALPFVLREYPDASIRIAGEDITYGTGSFKNRLRLSSYGKIIKKLIKDNGLEGRVVFTGPLNAEQMKQEYLKCNVFICPSSLENSPNSIGEAQALGVPVLASFVGGIPDLMNDKDSLFANKDTALVAYRISKLFELKEKVDTSSARLIALKRHDESSITSSLIKIYETIISH